MLPPQLQILIQQFTKLPGIGPRQAARFAFYLLRNQEEISSLANSLQFVREKINLCPNCFLPARQASELSDFAAGPASSVCAICANPKRDGQTICVVEKETDALSIEKSGHFQGRYYVLGGFIDPLEKEGIAYKRLGFFVQKLRTPKTTEGNESQHIEIILALTPRREGDYTSLYIEEQLKPLRNQGLITKITRLGRGLSSGAELEYADEETLKNALEGRK